MKKIKCYLVHLYKTFIEKVFTKRLEDIPLKLIEQSQVWYQTGDEKNAPRIRLISNERSRFVFDASIVYFKDSIIEGIHCCWDNDYFSSIEAKLEAMHAYDKQQGFPEAIFICYL